MTMLDRPVMTINPRGMIPIFKEDRGDLGAYLKQSESAPQQVKDGLETSGPQLSACAWMVRP